MSKQMSFGVVIGRFQVHALHVGHRHLLDYASARHEQLVILVGYNDVRSMPRNELPVGIRIGMIQHTYPDALVLPLPDSKISNEHWSRTVDTTIVSIAGDQRATLYGSRDSFIPKYSGRFNTAEVPALPDVSGTVLRNGISETSVVTAEQRWGWMAAIRSQRAVIDSVVDTAVVSDDWRQVLMGRRGPGGPLGFFGGFLDHSDTSDEAAALREQTEEVTGITTGELMYVGSRVVDDPRYQGSSYQMMTRFFVTEYVDGEPVGADDMPLVEWVDLQPETKTLVKESHHPLFDLLLEYRSRYHSPD